MSYANVMSTLALFVALGGTSYAAVKLPSKSVGEKQLRSGAVTSSAIRDGAVAAKDLAPGAIATGPRGPRGVAGPGGPQGPAGAGLAPLEGWKALPFVNGWGNYGGIFQTGGYRKDQYGVIKLRGLVQRGSAPADGPIAVLPAGYRPDRARVFSVKSGTTVGRVDMRNNGELVWQEGATDPNPGWISLEGIEFDAD